jgi:XTP/dITP diphosphohydrolase
MSVRLFFATGNGLKFKYARLRLEKFGLQLEQVHVDVPELQSTDVRAVAEYSARFAGELLGAAVIKTDVSFEIDALNGFPGPFIRFINQWLTPEQMLSMLKDEMNRRARFVDTVALYEPGRGCTSFLSVTAGSMAGQPEGQNGWGIDRIFVPDGHFRTIAAMSDDEKIAMWDHSHWEQMGQYLHDRMCNPGGG